MSSNSPVLDKLSFQEIVFKRWINHILLPKNVKLENLYGDLGNGIYIVYLIEVLTTHEFKCKIRNPSFRTQKMENITMVLKYLQENEHIKFLNIDSSNILNKESKIVLSFIWYIIEYFSIIKPLDSYFHIQRIKSPGKSTKQKFISWLKCKVPMTIKNLTSDCKNGKIIGALVNSCKPDLCANWFSWSDKNSLENVKMSINIAEKELGVPPLIDPVEFINEKLDEKSVMTYLSQFLFYNSKQTLLDKDIGAIISAEFKGLDQLSYRINDTVTFSICSSNMEGILLQYTDPTGCKTIIDCSTNGFNAVLNEGQLNFVPSLFGQYTLDIISKISKEILKSSVISVENVPERQNFNERIFDSNYFRMDDDPDYWEAFLDFKGRGLQSIGIRSGDSVQFIIETSNHQKLSPDLLDIQITSPDLTLLPFQKKYSNNLLVCCYNPVTIGVYEISVSMSVPKLQKLFKVNVGEKSVTQIVAFGPGLNYATTTNAAIFVVETNGETGTLNFTIEGPNEAHIECTDNGDGSATVVYWPTTPGEYAVHILYENEDIKDSPFMAKVVHQSHDIKLSEIKAYGSALCNGHLTVGQVAHFTVDILNANERLDLISVNCYNRFGEELSVKLINDAIHKRTYSLTPVSSVKLTLFISFDKICVSGSPYLIFVTEDKMSNKIRVQGSGIQSAFVGVETQFFVDGRLLTKEGQLKIVITDSSLHQIPCSIEQTSNNIKIYSVKYTPTLNNDKCFVEIFYDNISVFDEPIVVPISNVNTEIIPEDSASQNDRVKPSRKSGNDADSLDYSDIFLDPKAESYLTLIMPPDSYCDTTLPDLPLPPPDITDDSGDTSLDIMPAKFPLSTVIEESEDTYSVKDSIFSSECHSRASLSRKSSITMLHSPNNTTASKPAVESNLNDISVNESSVNGCDWTAKTTVNQSKGVKRLANCLPPKVKDENPSLAELSDVNEFDEFFPLPEPPLDSELLCFNDCSVTQLSSADVHTINVDLVETISVSPFVRLVPFIITGSGREELHLLVKNAIYRIRLPSLFVNPKYLFESDRSVEVVLCNDTIMVKQSSDYESVFVDEKVDSEMSFSEMLPVTQMEAIISPYEGATNYLSDNSDNSLISDNTSIICTAHINFVNTPLDYLHADVNQIDRVTLERGIVHDHCQPAVKLVREITTSEVSEISETSLWVSNDEKLSNCHCEVEENSFVNTLSDMSKSGLCNQKSNQLFKFGHDNTERFHNTNNCKCSNIASKWVTDPGVICKSGRLLDDDKGADAMVKEVVLTKSFCTDLSSEIDICSDSCQSLSFPEPPSDLIKGAVVINVNTNKSNLYSKENFRTKSSKKIIHNKSNEAVLSHYHGIFKSSSKRDQHHQQSSIVSQDSAAIQCAYVKTCLTDSEQKNTVNKVFASINKPLLASSEICLNDRVRGDAGDVMVPLEIDVSVAETVEPHIKKSFVDTFPKSNNVIDCAVTTKVSIDGSFEDYRNATNSQRIKLQGKRRSLSQTNSDNSQFNFDLRNLKNLIPNPLYKSSMADILYPSKQHVRAHSESDRQRIYAAFYPEESIPTKQEKKEENISVSKEYNSISSLSTKEVILRRQLPMTKGKSLSNFEGDGQDCSLELASEKRRQSSLLSISVYGEGLRMAYTGNVAEFIIRTGGIGTDGISLSIEGPYKTEINTVNLPNGDCKVMYIPRWSGDYLLNIQHNGSQIEGSPFKVHVQSREVSKAALSTSISPVRNEYAEGQGLTNAYINYPNRFTIYTKDSGPGGLSLSIEGPSKAIIEFQDAKNGACGVTYRVTEPGLYTCIVKFNKTHIKNSPFSINIVSQQLIQANVKENKITDDKISPVYQIGKRAIFSTEFGNINTIGVSNLIAVLHCPFGSKKYLVVHKDTSKDCVWVEFIPHVAGSHLLYIIEESQRNEAVNTENAFVLMVEEPSDFDQVCFEREIRSIKVYGKGLVKGRAGYSNIFFIEIGESVSGALNVTVDGPSKVEIKCNETEKGFKFSYIPGISGDYLVTIKYGGEKQIKGSPFQVKIIASNKNHKINYSRRKPYSSPLSQSSTTELSTTLSSDNNAISCFGSGLHVGKVHTWMDFYVDASKTKTINHLFVGIIGPSEPCDEIRICYMDSYRFLVSYKARERGSHNLIIKWGDTHISCSPTTIDIE